MNISNNISLFAAIQICDGFSEPKICPGYINITTVLIAGITAGLILVTTFYIITYFIGLKKHKKAKNTAKDGKTKLITATILLFIFVFIFVTSMTEILPNLDNHNIEVQNNKIDDTHYLFEAQ